MSHFYTPWKHQKTFGFPAFGGIEKWNIGLKWVNEKYQRSKNSTSFARRQILFDNVEIIHYKIDLVAKNLIGATIP